MYKILIVDDEKIIRDGLQILINRMKEYKIVGVCRNGKEALETTISKKPDIVITDIRMPVMDGLEFIDKCIDIKDPPKIVILSGYDDFEYARKAFRLHVCDYLLKPISHKDLIEKLSNISVKIEKEKKRNDLIKKQIGMLLINKSIAAKSVAEDLLLQKNMQINNCQVMLVSIKNANKDILKRVESEIESIFNYKVEKIIFCERNYIVIILINNKVLPDEFYRDIANNIKENFKLDTIIGIGSLYNDKKQIYTSYKEAEYALIPSIYSENEKIFNYNINWSLQDKKIFYDKKKSELLDAVQKCSINEANNIIKSVFGEIKEQNFNPEILINFLSNIDKIFNKYIYGYENIVNLNDLSKPYLYSEIFNNHIKIQEIKELVLYNIKTIVEFLESNRNQTSGQILDEIIIYIKENYNKDLCLESVCDKFYINISYFCKIFKKKTGVTFNHHLKELRLSKAKELLKNENIKVYQIAELVGYKNAKYFAKIFKDNTNQTPMEYKALNFRKIY